MWIAFDLVFWTNLQCNAQSVGLTPICTTAYGTDYPVCTTEEVENCDIMLYSNFINFAAENYYSSYNSLNCSLTLLHPGNIIYSSSVIVLDDDIAQYGTFPTAQVTSISRANPGLVDVYTVSIRNASTIITYAAHIACQIGDQYDCNPFFTPYYFPLCPQAEIQYGSIHDPDADCLCSVAIDGSYIIAENYYGEVCAYANLTSIQSVMMKAKVCYEYPSLETFSLFGSNFRPAHTTRGVVTPVFPFTPGDLKEISCQVTHASSEDYLLVSRDSSQHSVALISWNDYIISQVEFNNTILTYLLPDEVHDKGGVINVVVTYDDLTSWSTCSSVLEGADECDNENLTMVNSPWDCMSTLSKAVYILMCIFLAIAALLIMVVLAYIFLKCFLLLVGCYYGMIGLPNSRIGSWITRGLAASYAVFQPVQAQQTEIEAAELSISIVIMIFVAGGFFIALALFIIKLFLNRKGKAALIDMSRDTTNKFKRDNPTLFEDKYSPKTSNGKKATWFTTTLALSMLILGISGCNNSFLINSKHGTCINNGTSTVCSIETTLQTTFSNIGSCMEISSSDKDTPFALTVTLLKMGYEINTKYLYNTIFAECAFDSQVVCDINGNAGGESQCQQYNDFSRTCTSVNDDATHFPLSPSYYTLCQCVFISDDPASCGFPTDMSKIFSYAFPYNAYSGQSEVTMSTFMIPVYIFSVSVSDSSPTTYTCIVTPHNSHCNVPGLSFSLISEIDTIMLTGPVYFFDAPDGSGDRYYSLNAEPKGNPTSCNLGSIQGDGSNDFSDATLIFYEDFCRADLTYSYYSIGEDFCDPNYQSYGTILPAYIDGLGTVQYYSDNSTGFHGYIATNVANTPTVTMDILINKDLNFTLNQDAVCPTYITSTQPVGCYDCDTPASFTLTATSTCLEGPAYVDCDTSLTNPVIQLSNEATVFTLSFYADSSNPSFTCEIVGDTKDSFKVKTTNPLQKGPVQFSHTISNTTSAPKDKDKSWLDQFNNNDLSPTDYMTFAIVIVIGIIVVIIILIFLYLIFKCVAKAMLM